MLHKHIIMNDNIMGEKNPQEKKKQNLFAKFCPGATFFWLKFQIFIISS